jgi:hypothetical protein
MRNALTLPIQTRFLLEQARLDLVSRVKTFCVFLLLFRFSVSFRLFSIFLGEKNTGTINKTMEGVSVKSDVSQVESSLPAFDQYDEGEELRVFLPVAQIYVAAKVCFSLWIFLYLI